MSWLAAIEGAISHPFDDAILSLSEYILQTVKYAENEAGIMPNFKHKI